MALTDTTPRLTGRTILAGSTAMGMGATIAVQSGVNGELSVRTLNGVLPAWLTMVSGLFFLCIVLAFHSRARRGVRRLLRSHQNQTLKSLSYLGGLYGSFFLIVQGIAVPEIGVAAFSVGAVAGQSMGALIVDRLGISASGTIPITRARAIATFLAISAVVIGISGRSSDLGTALFFGFGAFMAGVLIAPQQAGNSRLAVVSGSPLSAALINFLGGAIVLTFVLAALTLMTGIPQLPASDSPWWIWVGGILGVIIISGSAWTVPTLGVLLFSLLSVFGQLTAALFLDIFAHRATDSLTWRPIVAVALTLIAVIITARSRFSYLRDSQL